MVSCINVEHFFLIKYSANEATKVPYHKIAGFLSYVFFSCTLLE